MDNGNIKYVLMCENDAGAVKYFAIDYPSGGVSYWTSTFQNAIMFDKLEKAEEILQSADFTRESKMISGTICPPRMLALATDLSLQKRTGKVTVFICPILVKPDMSTAIKTMTYNINIKDPVDFIYQNDTM